MKHILLWIFALSIVTVVSTAEVIHRLHKIFRKPILFPKSIVAKKFHTCCNLPSGDRGICISIHKCPVVQSWLRKTIVKYSDIQCGWYDGIPHTCCPTETQRISDTKNSLFDLCKPKYNFKECGSPLIYKEDLKRVYSMNETAERYRKEGFTVVPTEVDVDRLISFRVFNKTHMIKPPDIDVHEAVGGENARRVVTSYMALIGILAPERPLRWICGGVIINRDWILSAAHCFLDLMKNGNIDLFKMDSVVIRLGEYDFDNDDLNADEFPLDFGIKEVKFFPQYNYPKVYHDLMLIKLKKSIPYHRPDMRPVCLPWEQEADRNLVGSQVTLTGWGSAFAHGPLSPKPQEVNVTVFDTSICERSYSSLGDYPNKFPHGIHSDKLMCAGDKQGGKDACMGDSGGPIVYQDKSSKFTLAGIVSSGYGCGLDTHPGIYIPINKSEYLLWIKKMAFTELLVQK